MSCKCNLKKCKCLSTLSRFLKFTSPWWAHRFWQPARNTHPPTRARNTKKGEADERDDSQQDDPHRMNPSLPVSHSPSPPSKLLPASLFSIKCQDWPFYNHICDWGSEIQMQSMSIRMKGLLIEKEEMVWGIFPPFYPPKYCNQIYTPPI